MWAIYKWWFARIFEPFPSVSFFFFFLVTKYSAMHDSCSFYFITTMLWVALDIGYISIAKSVVFFEVGNGEAHAYNTYREL